jgi:hypothetical protein
MQKKSKGKNQAQLSKTNLTQNKLYLSVLVTIAIVILVNIVWALTHIHKTELPVPIRYTSLTNFDQLGKWYQLYFPLAISLVVSVVNIFLSINIYKKSRIVSMFLLLASLIVAVFALAITFGFTSINYGTG